MKLELATIFSADFSQNSQVISNFLSFLFVCFFLEILIQCLVLFQNVNI